MTRAEAFESINHEVFQLSREDLVNQLTHFTGPLKLDFTLDYLASCSTDRMRHLLVAALWRLRTRELATV